MNELELVRYVGCYSDNLPSVRTIEKYGGVLTETKPYLKGISRNSFYS